MDQGKVKSKKKTYQHLWIRMSPEQMVQFRNAYAVSSDKSMSDYGRKLVLGEPVKVYYRDRAFDEFTEAAILFRKEASLIIERAEWTESEKIKLEGMLEEMYRLHIKIHEHARNNKKKTRGSHNSGI